MVEMKISFSTLRWIGIWGMLGQAVVVKTMSLQELLKAENTTLSMLNGLLSTLPNLLTTLETAQDITILAPNNAAFISYLSNPNNAPVAADPVRAAALLQYHVIPSIQPSTAFNTNIEFLSTLLTDPKFTNVTGGQVVQGSKNSKGMVEFVSALKEKSTVHTSDLKFTNGILHIVDTVLTVPITPSFSALDSNLTAFGGALAQARYYHALDEMRDVTIFAPSNAAFQAISSTASSLSSSQLQSLLQYHILPSRILRSLDLLALTPSTSTIQTLNGGTVNISVVNGGVFVNSARVVESDILVANGVLHVLDNVLNPQNPSVPPDPGSFTQAPVFAAAAETGATVPFTAGIVATTTAPSARQTGIARKVEGRVGMAMLVGVGAVGFVGL